MKQRTLFIVGVTLVSVGVVGLVSALMLGRMVSQPESSSGRPTPVDRMFIEQMVPHHQDAIDMAEIALDQAEHREVRELAQQVIESQSAENEQMRGWYEEWFNAQVPDARGGSGMMGPMMGGGSDLERLRNAADFDREFIEQMVPHHRMGIMMARMAGRSTGRSEISQLTASIIETQSDEIRDMQRWHQEWYDR